MLVGVPVEHEASVALTGHQPATEEAREVVRCVRLRESCPLRDLRDVQRTLRQRIKDEEPGRLGEAVKQPGTALRRVARGGGWVDGNGSSSYQRLLICNTVDWAVQVIGSVHGKSGFRILMVDRRRVILSRCPQAAREIPPS